MTLPSWLDENLGSMIRAALWLETEVGEGNVFTKAQLRDAFPTVSQIDRRMRDLRKHGWQIDTKREDPGLKQQEQRYVAKGAEVWIPGQAKAEPKASLTATQRLEVMQADHFLCRSCGIGAGEAYADGGQEAQLDIARRKVKQADGSVIIQPVTECNRCRVGGKGRGEDLQALLAEIGMLTSLERQILAGWIEADRRALSPLERLWGQYRTFPEELRRHIAQAVSMDSSEAGDGDAA